MDVIVIAWKTPEGWESRAFPDSLEDLYILLTKKNGKVFTVDVFDMIATKSEQEQRLVDSAVEHALELERKYPRSNDMTGR